MVNPPPSSSSSSWRNPSAEVAAKYNLVELPESFEPTPQEEDLLKMYDKVRALEKEAKRIREEQARNKLVAADSKYKQAMESTTEDQVKKKKPRNKRVKRREEQAGPDDEDEYSSEEDEQQQPKQEPSLNEQREQRLAELREDVERKHAKETEEEAMRAELLKEEAATEDTGPSLKRKRNDATTTKSSLLANLSNQATPPHQFSKSLELSKIWQGKFIFPTSANETSWSPPPSASQPNEGALELELPDFDISQAQHGQGNNTIAIKFTSPSDAKRFSLNIAGPDHSDFYSVFFHFNPRAVERGGQVVLNDKKEGQWGQALNIPLHLLNAPIFGQESNTLVIQINGDGFDVILDGMHYARLEHRQQLPSGRCSLYLQFPSTDDYGSPELWTVYRVWWGNKKSMAMSGDALKDVYGVGQFSTTHPRKLFIRLDKIFTDSEVDIRRAQLERDFRKYGGDHGVITIVQKDKAFAFVELESERQAELALQEMSHLYQMNPARQTRQEAFEEEKATAEAAKEGTTKETSDWD